MPSNLVPTLLKLVDRLVPPHLRGSQETLRNARLFVGYVLAIVLSTPAHFINAISEGGIAPLALGLSATVWNLVLLGAVWARLPARAAANASLLWGSAILALYVVGDGGPFSAWGELFCIVPMAAFVLTGVHGALFWTVGCVLVLGGLQLGVEQIPSAQQAAASGIDGLAITRMRVLITVYVSSLAILLEYMHRQREADLRAARDAADAANAVQGRFLAHMSHELRTPMSGVIGTAEVMLLDGSLCPARRAQIQQIHDSGSALVGILNDILDLAAVERGRVRLADAPWSVRDLLDEICGLYQGLAGEQGISLQHSTAPQVPERLSGDVRRVRQVLLNLVGNAVKFTPKGAVNVHASWSDEWLIVRVLDTGIGIKPHQRKTLFQPFSEAEPSQARERGGHGLGLSISRSLVEAMGGTIGAESTPGKGSQFWFRVPASAAREHRAPTTTLAAVTAMPTHSGSVLLVEDVAINQAVLCMMLDKLGLQAEVSAHGEEALERILAGGDWSVILMDWQLPGIDGVEIVRRMRAAGDSRPVICVTAHARDTDRDIAFAAGMDDFLNKPVRMDDLRAALVRLGVIELVPPAPEREQQAR